MYRMWNNKVDKKTDMNRAQVSSFEMNQLLWRKLLGFAKLLCHSCFFAANILTRAIHYFRLNTTNSKNDHFSSNCLIDLSSPTFNESNND